MAKAPLLLGCDLTSLDQDILDIIANPEVIAVNQDDLGAQAKCIYNCESYEGVQVLMAPLQPEKGVLETYAIEFINFGSKEGVVPELRWEQDLLLTETIWLSRDLWGKAQEGVFSLVYPEVKLQPYGSHLIKVQPYQGID